MSTARAIFMVGTYVKVLVNVERIRVYWSSNKTLFLNAIVNK